MSLCISGSVVVVVVVVALSFGHTSLPRDHEGYSDIRLRLHDALPSNIPEWYRVIVRLVSQRSMMSIVRMNRPG